MSRKNNDQTSQEDTGDTTFLSYADLFGELDASAAGAAEAGVGEVEGLPSGAALLVVKRGPNAGSRFLLDQPVTSAGRGPGCDIFLDDVTVEPAARRVPRSTVNSRSLTSAASTAPMSTVNRWPRRCWPTATRS